jgi:hypothetical protein
VTSAPPLSASRQQLAALRQDGAHRFDPVRFHFLETLATRALGQTAPVQQLVENKLAQALAEWDHRRAAAEAAEVAEEVQNAAAEAPTTPLRALTDYLAQALQTGQERMPKEEGQRVARPELKSLRDYRTTWSLLSAERQLTLALQQAPRNAGPINSHMLVLRSLALMRDTAPDYLSRFVSYADTLLCLEQNERTPLAAATAKAKADSHTGKNGKPKKAKAPGSRAPSLP